MLLSLSFLTIRALAPAVAAAVCGDDTVQIEGQLRALLSFFESDPRWEAIHVDFSWR